ncbi:MAG: hypothetical protein KDA65_11280 [Planctomycetaceae bacterium]|nr:hypothetical protein [Planctomycetaceae bacterium]
MTRMAGIVCAVCLVNLIAISSASEIVEELSESLYEISDPSFLNNSASDWPSSFSSHGSDHDIKEGRPDSHAPAGLMGDHVHHKGGMMFEYKFMNMYMDGNRFGSDSVSDVAALDVTGIPFMATPTRMNMDMHMIHMMYGMTDDITLYVMPMWTELTMDHLRRNGTTFRVHTDGFDDTNLGALIRLYEGETDEIAFNLGCSVPTGSINNTTTRSSPVGAETIVPYPMRIGSGTFNARPGITYKKYWDSSSTGVQFQTDLPIDHNYRGYAVSNEYRLNWWYAYRPVDPLALTFRAESLWRENYDGTDPELNPNMISTARTDMRGGYWFNLGLGAIYQLPDASRLAFEMVIPLAQELDGVQLETDSMLFASWSKAF